MKRTSLIRQPHTVLRRGGTAPDKGPPQRNVVRGDHVIRAKEDRALDHVPQLADVARPSVADEFPPRLRREGLLPGVEFPVALHEEVVGECGDILAAIAQRGHVDRHDPRLAKTES